MKNKLIFGTILTLSLAFIVSAACITPAFAQVTYYAHANASGATIIDLPNHQPKTQIVVMHFDRGDHGAGDYLEVSTWQFVPPLGKSVWATVAIVTDSPSIAAFYRDFVFVGLPGVPVAVLLVKQCQLEVFRICKTVSAYWTEPITCPAVILPPGFLLFSGYGSAQTASFVHKLPNGVTLAVNNNVDYSAHAFFSAPAWKYCGPVGDESTTIDTNVDLHISHA